jgi:HAD superfamily hydrolase (TIGR01509 family)
MAVAAIFDIDGTLVRFNFDVQGTRKVIIDELKARGVDTTGLNLATPTQQILDTAKSRMQAAGPGEYELLRRKVFSILDSFELDGVASTTAFPGTRKTLLDLKSMGVRLAVVTNSGRKAAFASLGRAGILDCFEFVLTRDDTEVMKPRPEGLLKAVSMFSLPKDSIFYVGDSTFDIIAAKRAGLRMVSVATGNYSVERLRTEGADFVISSISELSRVLGMLPE